MSRLAIFDIDATLVHPSTGVQLATGMRRQGLIGPWQVLSGIFHLSMVRLNLMSYSTLIRKGMSMVEGRRFDEVETWFERVFVEQVRFSFIESTTRKLLEHRRQGDTIALISATSSILGRYIAEALEVEYWVCAEVRVEDGLIVNEVMEPVPYGAGKVVHAQGFADALGMKLEDAFFYTDSISDLPLMERVGNPVVVNPDPFLRAVGRKRDWPLLEDRRSADIRVLMAGD